MKKLLIESFLMIISLSSCITYSTEESKKTTTQNNLSVIPEYKGSYFLGNHREYGTFFIFEIKLINNTKSSIEFWTLTAASTANIVIEPDTLNFFIPQFSGNDPTIINLKPEQEFVVILALNRNDTIRINSLRFGFILYEPVYKSKFPKKLDYELNPKEELYKMRKEKKNVIWSKNIDLYQGNEYRYQIRTTINDSTYSIIPRKRLFY
jgi:hypothetical protein